jgi:hypothetical protein
MVLSDHHCISETVLLLISTSSIVANAFFFKIALCTQILNPEAQSNLVPRYLSKDLSKGKAE